MQQHKKGQAAMEFLMTYGWAILAAIIAIGVLAYFGVFSPGRFVQDSVFISAPLGAVSAQVSATSGTGGTPGASIEILNGAGDTITITTISISPTSPSVAACTAINPATNLDAGEAVPFTLDCTGIAEGDRFRGDISVTYTLGSANFPSTATGSITHKVQA